MSVCNGASKIAIVCVLRSTSLRQMNGSCMNEIAVCFAWLNISFVVLVDRVMTSLDELSIIWNHFTRKDVKFGLNFDICLWSINRVRWRNFHTRILSIMLIDTSVLQFKYSYTRYLIPMKFTPDCSYPQP